MCYLSNGELAKLSQTLWCSAKVMWHMNLHQLFTTESYMYLYAIQQFTVLQDQLESLDITTKMCIHMVYTHATGIYYRAFLLRLNGFEW